ncbi:rhodanese-related sulfurtransferase [Nocardioides salarius]|uniref:Rhodanese-related sulfurtransferase n=1 Tax=Nocardioides salarius TaxID=374513 RepID=A0ABS2MEE4_9ACTN|nr:rhodanese-like domain-containing protein [Nocardioides salarius]MBM7509554.1 rhodanese-related sulfurtransferase [Nocardioides salarius]
MFLNPLPRLSITVIAGLAAVILLSACGSDPSPNADDTAVRVSPATFADLIAKPATFVLNVHTPDEGSIPGTEANIPFDRLRTRVDELPADSSALIAVYCRSGNMSTLATVTLSDLGYTDVIELDGGMEAWRADGRALLPPDQAARKRG